MMCKEKEGQAARDVKYRILIADDDDDTREVYQQMLCRSLPPDTLCDAVADGAQAVRHYDAMRARGHNYDILILDVMMPFLNGFQVAEHVRITHRDMHPDIVIISALDKNDPIAAMRVDYVKAVEVWQKPVDPDEFKLRVAYLLAQEDTFRAARQGALAAHQSAAPDHPKGKHR
jgi:DNA-binding response OmpR family regulator